MLPRLQLTKVTVTLKVPVILITPFVWPMLICRRIRFGYPFRKIPLTRGKFAIVDPEDYYQLSRYKWHTEKTSSTFYASRGCSKRHRKSGFIRFMHRYIIKAPRNMCVDHINHNGLDNRKANLRLATSAQNSRNRKKNTTKTTSKYKGVFWSKKRKKWLAQIVLNKKQSYLGLFEDETEAAKA